MAEELQDLYDLAEIPPLGHVPARMHAQLIRQSRFGEPRLDIRDRTVRKLQFMTGGCVIDAYLYATARGKEPIVTHTDARTPEGRDVDLAVCGIS